MVLLRSVECMVDLRRGLPYGFPRADLLQKFAQKYASREHCPTLCLWRANERQVLACVADEHVEPVLLSHVDSISDDAEDGSLGQNRPTSSDVGQTLGLEELGGSFPVSFGLGRPRARGEMALSHESRSYRWACLSARFQNGLLTAVRRSAIPSGRPARKNGQPSQNLSKNLGKKLKNT